MEITICPPIPSTIDCGVCHGNNPAAETWAVDVASIPMLHIPVLVGADCSACHGEAYTIGGFGPATAVSAAKHAFVSTTCDTCHDTGKSFYVGSGTPLQLRPADHLSNTNDPRKVAGDCSLCHSTTDWNSTGCAQCHGAAHPKRRDTLRGLSFRLDLHVIQRRHLRYNWSGNAAKKAAVPQTTRSTVGLLVNNGLVPRNSRIANAAAGLTPMSHAGVFGHCASCHNGVQGPASQRTMW